MTNFLKKRKWKKQSKPTDGKNIIKLVLNLKEKGTKKEQEMFIDALNLSHEKTGTVYIQRALEDGTLTIDEIDKSMLDTKDWCTVLQAVFARKDNHIKQDRILILTLLTTNIYKEKNWLEKKFSKYNIKIVDSVKASKILKNEKKNI